MEARLISPGAFVEALAAPRRPFVLDVRSAALFALGHVPGSVNVPVHDLGRRRRDLPASLVERILLVGDDRHRTLAAARFLDLMGFGDVAVLEGGIATWEGPLAVLDRGAAPAD